MFSYEALHATIAELRQKQIFFIGGTPKSGTTWLRFLLDAHPQVSCRGEGHFIDVLAPALKAAVAQHQNSIAGTNQAIFSEVAGYPHLDSHDLTYVLASCIALFLVKQSRHTRLRAIGEKTPDNSSTFLRSSPSLPKRSSFTLCATAAIAPFPDGFTICGFRPNGRCRTSARCHPMRPSSPSSG